MAGFRVVICGGGIAAVEGLLRLRALAADALEIEVIAPNDDLVMRPLAVREPFSFGTPQRYPLGRIARDAQAELTKDALDRVDPGGRVVHTAEGREANYDALLIAVGARQVAAYEHVATFRDADADAVYRGIVQDVEDGYSRRVTFVQPVGPVWPLPLYELALMTAERSESMDVRDLELSIVTPEPRPLAVFGNAVSEVVANRLARAGVRTYTSSLATVPAKGTVAIRPQNVELEGQRIVAMPRIAGPGIEGLPDDSADGFLPIDQHCAVRDTDGRVFAAGDAANYPVKHGGLGAQMADAAAEAIAVLAGAKETAAPFQPVIRGKLLTGREPVYMSAHPVGPESFESTVHDEPPWPAGEKVVAEELGGYLAGLDAAGAGRPSASG
jgi:sulfide:quinone oxidoreductase